MERSSSMSRARAFLTGCLRCRTGASGIRLDEQKLLGGGPELQGLPNLRGYGYSLTTRKRPAAVHRGLRERALIQNLAVGAGQATGWLPGDELHFPQPDPCVNKPRGFGQLERLDSLKPRCAQ